MFPWGLVPLQKIHGVLSAEDKSFLATPCKFSIANRKRRAGRRVAKRCLEFDLICLQRNREKSVAGLTCFF